MKVDRKWIRIAGLALSLPTTILVLAIVLKELVSSGLISKFVSISIFLVVIGNTLLLMVIYAYKNKN